MTGDFSVDTYIQRTAEVHDQQSLVRLFCKLFSSLGIDAISYYLTQQCFRPVSAKEGARVKQVAQITDELYGAGLPFDFDPVIAALIEKLEPFHWFSAEHDDRLSDDQRRIFTRLREEGFIDGIVVPVMRRPGEVAVFTLSKKGAKFSFTKIVLLKVQVACFITHLRFEELSNGDCEALLSSRETDVMRLVSRGMSNREIAELLSLSAHTVDTLIRRCFVKLGVTNRIEASIMFTFRDKLSA